MKNFLKFNFSNIQKSETSFNLQERFELIFELFNVKNIDDLSKKIILIKQKANLVDDLKILKVDLNKNYDRIIKGVNLLRLGNNPVKIVAEDIYNIISKKSN